MTAHRASGRWCQDPCCSAMPPWRDTSSRSLWFLIPVQTQALECLRSFGDGGRGAELMGTEAGRQLNCRDHCQRYPGR